MEEKLWSVYEARAKIIKAMAHPARLFMIEELKKGERCVCELTEMIGYDISTISKHLSILKNAGIVGDRKSGTSSFYYLKVPCIINFFGCVEDVMKSNLKHHKDLLSLVK